ncbi:hypothetical protein PSCLAVI8L_50129 [Pseudoclavibacter sp. 8L]|nr:hypothetical protein PSCLAVI8L_50129 [Pseudoclavibacter sp. 8L]
MMTLTVGAVSATGSLADAHPLSTPNTTIERVAAAAIGVWRGKRD